MPVMRNIKTTSGSGILVGAAGGVVLRYCAFLIYAISLCYAYEVLSLWWAYFGYTYKLADHRLLYVACLLSALPSILLSARPKTYAECTAWFLYILVFLPCLLVPVMQYSSDTSRLLQIFLTTLVGSVLFLVLTRGAVKRVDLKPLPPKLFWGGLAAVWVILMASIIYSFGGAIRFVGIDDIYTQRFAGAESASAIARYALALLASAINPFLIAVGLYTQKRWLTGIGILAQVFLFGTLAARAVLLSPIFVIGVYFLFNKKRQMKVNNLLAVLLILVAATAPFLASYDPLGGGINNVLTLVYLRTLLISGAFFGVYEQFFALYPLTYFSHSNIVSLFIQYPYGDLSVGQAVMLTLVPSASRDIGELNANFLATDGIAAIGVGGVPIVSALSAIVLRLLSRFVPPERNILMMAAGTGFILSMANTSLLTSLITGGGIVLVALVALAPLQKNTNFISKID